jgi:hypothetical protein
MATAPLDDELWKLIEPLSSASGPEPERPTSPWRPQVAPRADVRAEILRERRGSIPTFTHREIHIRR